MDPALGFMAASLRRTLQLLYKQDPSSLCSNPEYVVAA
jgi:hypothetical protein